MSYIEKYIHRFIWIKGWIRQKHSNYVRSKSEHAGENIIHRNFEAKWKNLKWCIDVTELKNTGHKHVY